jgi:phage head maturation protease
VTFRNITTTPNTTTAYNLFADVNSGDTSASNVNCAIAREGTAWYLIAAEC